MQHVVYHSNTICSNELIHRRDDEIDLCFRSGPNQWRDSIRPRKILYDVCKRNHLPLPQLLDDGSIQIGETIFRSEDFGTNEKKNPFLFFLTNRKCSMI